MPYIGCSGPRYNEIEAGRAANTTDTGRTVVSEVWYFMHAYRRPQDHHTMLVDSTTLSGCTNATNAVRYYETTVQDAAQPGNYTS